MADLSQLKIHTVVYYPRVNHSRENYPVHIISKWKCLETVANVKSAVIFIIIIIIFFKVQWWIILLMDLSHSLH